MFDPNWESSGTTDRVVDLFMSWVGAQKVEGLKTEVVREAGRTPLIFLELPASAGSGGGTVLLYGCVRGEGGGRRCEE
jgi:hypothetical protein